MVARARGDAAVRPGARHRVRAHAARRARSSARRVPRALAIVLVYVVVLGTLARLRPRRRAAHRPSSSRTCGGELPALGARGEARSGSPRCSAKMRALGLGAAGAAVTEDEPGSPSPTSAFVARPQPDGSLAIDVGTGVAVVETKNGWLVEPVHETKGEPFDPNRVVADAVGKSFAYAQQNSLEVARAVRDLVAGVSRVIFVFFITLMLAAYMMLTRERILGFFPSLVRPSGAGELRRAARAHRPRASPASCAGSSSSAASTACSARSASRSSGSSTGRCSRSSRPCSRSSRSSGRS